jgi:mersacidin/lichenicidin family type 2 lantibiotic
MDVVRAWKDPEYRGSLTSEELHAVPEHPCGPVRLTDEMLTEAGVGGATEGLWSVGCCGGFTRGTYCGTCSTCWSCPTANCYTIAGCTA